MAEDSPRSVIGFAVVLAIILAGVLFFVISRDRSEEVAQTSEQISGTPTETETPAPVMQETQGEAMSEPAAPTPEALVTDQGAAMQTDVAAQPAGAPVNATAATGPAEFALVISTGMAALGAIGLTRLTRKSK